MERQIVTVGINGQLVLPPEVQAALHLEPGSSMEVSIDDSRLILNLLPEPKPFSNVPASALALRGLFADSPSLEDTLLELRRSDRW